jgi:hypothetical protein
MATTTNYGFEIPDDTDLVKDGALAMRDLGQDVDTQLFTALGGNYPGLRLVKKQTIGTGVSSVQVTSAFSATYDAYKIVVVGGVTSNSATSLLLTLGATATGYYSKTVYGVYTDNTVLGFGSANGSSWQNAGQGTTNGLSLDVELQAPFLATRTLFSGSNSGQQTNEAYYQSAGYLNNATSYTSFTITTGGGTMTGGTIYVYGYGAS